MVSGRWDIQFLKWWRHLTYLNIRCNVYTLEKLHVYIAEATCIHWRSYVYTLENLTQGIITHHRQRSERPRIFKDRVQRRLAIIVCAEKRHWLISSLHPILEVLFKWPSVRFSVLYIASGHRAKSVNWVRDVINQNIGEWSPFNQSFRFGLIVWFSCDKNPTRLHNFVQGRESSIMEWNGWYGFT